MRAFVAAAGLIALSCISAPTGAEAQGELRHDGRVLLGEATRYGNECPDLSVNEARVLEIAMAIGLPPSSVLASSQDVGRSIIGTVPLLGVPSAPMLSPEQCAYGYELYGPEGSLMVDLLVRVDPATKVRPRSGISGAQ